MNYHRDEDYIKFESTFKNIFRKRFNLVQRFVKKGKGLDIGCSNGVFLDLFKERGWDTWGVEPSKNSKVASKKGHKVIRGFFEEVKLPENYFDLVIMNHTLEHMDDPLKVLKKVETLLKKNGVIFVDVPNAGGLGAKILGKHWPYLLPEEHKHQFTKRSLEKIFKEAGFKVIHFESRSGLFEFANPFLELWQSFIGLKKRFLFNLLTLPYALFATLLNMGDSMSIIGKKI